MTKQADVIQKEEKYYVATQWQLMRQKFVKHKLAMAGLVVLALLYTLGIFSDFFATQDYQKRNTRYINAPPQRIRFIDADGHFHLRPFVYGLTQEMDPETWRRTYVEDTSVIQPIRFFVRTDTYKFWGLFDANIRFMGVDEGPFFLFGTDGSGRDLFSRVMYATRISLTVGLVGVFLSFVLGCVFGGISGYYVGKIDMVIHRVIEFLISIPTIPL
ncbi:MAG: ABC transporter permease, partial [Bacillota bacterium]|nr:ABC transporter permease [Bacillota bacterium]